MIMTSVTSSNIAAIGYSPIDSLLRVEFNNGRTYEYSDVPQNIAQGLQDADSVGQYFHLMVKNQYQTQEV